MTRKKTGSKTEAEILLSSRRRCCICFGLNRDFGIKSGQIAHLDRDNSNDAYDNLAFLCLEHHDMYDSSTSQSKNFTISEVKKYREELYSSIVPIVEKHSSAAIASELSAPQDDGSGFNEHEREELKRIVVEVLSEIGPERSVTHLSSRVRLSRHSVERLLFQLSQENVVRIDREKGSTKKTYSLVNSSDNRLIDTFIGTLNEEVIRDERFIWRRHHELDAIVKTPSGCFAVETVLAFKELSRERIERSVSRLTKAKKELGLADATSVLLFGISTDTVREDIDLIKLEHDGILLKFIEMEL